MLFPGSAPWFVPDAPLPRVHRLAVIAPHPDDFDVIGITMRLFHDAGAAIRLAVLTSGASGVDDDFVAGEGRDAKRRVREAEQSASWRFFGLPAEHLHFLRLAEDSSYHLADTGANEESLLAFLSRSQPELVFLPHGNDPNLAHQRTFALALRCLNTLHSRAPVFLHRDPKTITMREDLYVVFGGQATDWKRGLLRHHESQQSRNLRTRGHSFDERIVANNARIATAAGRPGSYAEVFEVREPGT